MITIIATYAACGCDRKHFEVPKGYELLMDGTIQEGDLVLNFCTKKWEPSVSGIDFENVGEPICFPGECVCRKMEINWHCNGSLYKFLGIEDPNKDVDVILEIDEDKDWHVTYGNDADKVRGIFVFNRNFGSHVEFRKEEPAKQ